jgi:hypothetical protein
MMQPPTSNYSQAVAHSIGVASAGTVYALLSVYWVGFYEPAWGRGGSFQVVVWLALVMAAVSGVAYGAVLSLHGIKRPMTKPKAVAFWLGVGVLFLGAGLTGISQLWVDGGLLQAAACFAISSVAAAFAIARARSGSIHAAS